MTGKTREVTQAERAAAIDASAVTFPIPFGTVAPTPPSDLVVDVITPVFSAGTYTMPAAAPFGALVGIKTPGTAGIIIADAIHEVQMPGFNTGQGAFVAAELPVMRNCVIIWQKVNDSPSQWRVYSQTPYTLMDAVTLPASPVIAQLLPGVINIYDPSVHTKLLMPPTAFSGTRVAIKSRPDKAGVSIPVDGVAGTRPLESPSRSSLTTLERTVGKRGEYNEWLMSTDFSPLSWQLVSGKDFIEDNSVQTTDNTPTTIFSYDTLADERLISLRFTVWAREPATDDSAKYLIEGFFNRSGASVVASKGAPVFLLQHEDQASWNVQFVIASQNIAVNVAGEVAKTIEWRCKVHEIIEHG